MGVGHLMRKVWPPESPDLNPIEAIWDYIDLKMNRSVRTSAEKMWQMVDDVWNGISSQNTKKIHFFYEKEMQGSRRRQRWPYSLLINK
jgi:transposase